MVIFPRMVRLDNMQIVNLDLSAKAVLATVNSGEFYVTIYK